MASYKTVVGPTDESSLKRTSSFFKSPYPELFPGGWTPNVVKKNIGLSTRLYTSGDHSLVSGHEQEGEGKAGSYYASKETSDYVNRRISPVFS